MPNDHPLARRDVFVFDLDNTLYPAACNLFAQIDANMTAFVAEALTLPHAEARRVQKDLYVSHGTTLAGLMAEHDVCPHAFMSAAHDIDVSGLTACARLRAAIQALPGHAFVFTNGSVAHAENVTEALGLRDLFVGTFDVEMAGWTPKPHAATYERFLAHFALNPTRAVMFEDMADNLVVPHALGMATVLVQSDAPWCEDEPAAKRPARPGDAVPHADHVTTDLTGFLEKLTGRAPSEQRGAA